MAERDYKLGTSKPQKTFEITPFGAAIVEALPNHQRKRKIQRAFEKLGECPISDMFDSESAESFYRERGQVVKAID